MIRMQKEIMIVAKAKDISEKELWQMQTMDYYQALAVLESYGKDLDPKLNSGDGN